MKNLEDYKNEILRINRMKVSYQEFERIVEEIFHNLKVDNSSDKKKYNGNDMIKFNENMIL